MKKFKVGDKFILPDNSKFTGVYTIIKIDEGMSELRHWAVFPHEEGEIELWSSEEKMRLATKLEQALK